MNDPSLIDTERSLLRELVQLCEERATRLPELERTVRTKKAEAQRAFDADFQTAIVEFAAAKEALEREHAKTRERIQADYEVEKQAAEQEFIAARRRVRGRYAREKDHTKTAFQEAQWTLAALLEAKRNEAEERHKEVQNQVATTMSRLGAIRQEARGLLEHWRMPVEYVDGSLLDPADPRTRPKLRKLPNCLAEAERELETLKAMKLPRYSKGWRLPALIFLLWAVAVFPASVAIRWQLAIPLSGVGAAIVGVLTEAMLTSVARSRVLAVCMQMCRAIADAAPSQRRVLDHYAAVCQREHAKSKRRHDRALRKAYKEYKLKRLASKQRRAEGLQQAQDAYERRLAANEWRRTDDLRQNEENYNRRTAEIQARYDADAKEAHVRHQRERADIKARYDDERQALAERWARGVEKTQATVAALQQECARRFPAWDEQAWKSWTPPRTFPASVQFGQLQVRLGERLDGEAAELPPFTLPALLPFPGSSMLLDACDDGRTHAVVTLQTVMFRLLTTLPPGKVRFTIIDPIGLGQNFAAFMHLADYDEALVGGRIWTEQGHIEQRLADLTAHMENVIQKYLRNQFQTIEEYNASAGEVAEPFRFLIVANFPTNFSADAMRRLASIAQSGPRCGVYTLVTRDTHQDLPPGFDLKDLGREAVTLAWDGQRFNWQDADFGPYLLQLDPPPPNDLSMRVLGQVGELAREARRVEVPFEFIAPPVEQWWTGDSRQGLTVPLGRAGATKRQPLKLGQGTAQHVLVAGKTGSGKSTLLHALITNLSLLYSPDEVELYLVDFKKGVEFKTYAAHELPHARVVAIESEREFGLSVLQRLDAELRLRGERFRNAGVQDLAAYRQARPNDIMPRILLIVDEFQEFFVEDDRIAQDAAQLLDRLVRQGRAFGLHVLLGSQTLGGAYSLARSTIDQMAVRIALQCSEADAQLILSDDNAAARLLSRPGEAIYNDANGLLEGNNIFQVVWLPDDRREQYLLKVRERALKRKRTMPPQLVFEGNAPADPARNMQLTSLLQTSTDATDRRVFHAWLGEAIAIKDPTAASFRPMSGANLLIVGQQDEAALGMMATGIVGLAAQLPADSPISGARFYVLDGSPADARHRGLFQRLNGVVPHEMRVGGWREAPGLISELTEETERRQKTPDSETSPVFFVIYGLQRFRDLRRSEDDFGFSRREDEKPNPAQQFATLLREGASLGIHSIVWCDTYNNLQRALDRQSLREFDMRVLFQMGVADSSNLIDSPLAAKLGQYRALFYSEEQGRLEKFRPYGVPADAWLEEAGHRLAARGKKVRAAR
jgi:energy-coupling factor transporter ATP-binding protein EcfA2